MKSPTEETSSTIKISGSRWAATARSESHVHTARVALDRRVDEALNFCEGHDLVEPPLDVAFSHPEHRAVEVHVLTARQVGWKPDPTSRSEPTRPRTSNDPSVGSVMRERIFNSVLFPHHFGR